MRVIVSYIFLMITIAKGFEGGMVNDYNSNSALLNSIIQKLGRLDAQLVGLFDIQRECDQNSKSTKSRKDEMEVEISNEVDIIRKDLYTKMNGMIDGLKVHQHEQQAEALKLQQNISTLKKEKLDLYQKINELSKRISDMEMTIGQDVYSMGR